MAEPTFSIFLSSYNHRRFLSKALDALLSQSLQPRAIHVVDDASTDGSQDLIREYATRYPVIRPVFLEENRGLIRNMNDWLSLVEDDYIYFAASDDITLPGFFEKAIALLSRYPQAGLCSGLSRTIGEDGADLGLFDSPRPLKADGYIPPQDASRILMRWDSWFMGNTTIYRREALLESGGFDRELAGFTDGFACRAVTLKHGACFINEPLAAWRRMATGFAGHTTGDAETAMGVAKRAAHLMTDVHGGLFPEEYAKRWRDRWLYGAALSHFRAPSPQGLDRVRQLIAPAKPFDRIALSILGVLPAGRKMIGAVYLALRLRPYDILPALWRRLGLVFSRHE